ncbi:MAG: translation elongation factor Ts [Planctomycetota bacterium]
MITADAVKALREKTGLGMMECKMALTETGGDAVKAVDYLRKKGHDTAQKKAGRATKEGRIASYIHNGKIGVMVEIQCETDFVAKNDVFQQLLKDVAMHVVACSPLAVARAEIPAALVEKEKEIYRAQVDGKKPAPIIEKIVEGKLGKFYAEKCLLEQPFAKDPTRKVEDVLKEVIQKTGENIQIRRFVRLELGGE